ncbi:MAG: type II toxin-antitoxin system VapC family toxin [Nitrososphaerota archaeon]|jgi:predicted nucleic acid-binding protein|nr:type II toxin-antitoxin system VapC family toxin [Nitrososphaerota archaeon]MDG6919805.1 type II toxin-antitoxin system VapC family toxin [Nitrososphaerota archaeon]MDG6976960.1 type II toxin-antitoxin system VapC family toxin [Nitrososphaerota archaeon]MDG6989785.1 type II toxin-antitoxin system VapC family toxin [Nitrososphaerota archaeon]MDG6993223.1 type II toxin-antitoxin system VapC family toxin [Nitrososphaerota archaeon]
MKLYVADTVALARYLEDDLPSRAEGAFREAEAGAAVILIPEVVIGEFAYVALKGRLKTRDPKSDIRELMREIAASSYLAAAAMDPAAWEKFLDCTVPELHDRMIYSIASSRGASAIITPDKDLKLSGFPTLW